MAEHEEMKSREEEVMEAPQMLQQQRQTSTDQSNEISIGNKTAEDLVGDILASDPNDEDLDLMLTKSIALRTNNGLTTNDDVEKSNDLNVELKLRQADPINATFAKQHVNEVLSPSRILS